jgi:uncharacterized damage-inducible protein DinB
MQPMTPEQATFLLNTAFLPTLKNEHRITKLVIESIPLDKGDYRPEPIAKSALELAWHIVAAEHRFLGGIAAGGFDFTPNHRPESVKDSAGIAEWYADSFNKNIAAMSQASGEQLAKVIDFRGMFQLPAVMYAQFNLNHAIHHRGQLSTYLRPMGSKVPSIYGESYDSAEARKAAEAKASAAH